jgi:iron complex transport system substrate-binding protein
VTPGPTATTAPQSTTVAQPTPTPAADPFAGVKGIVDPKNHSWPREVEGLNGRKVITAQPRRIITASVGHDEMALALVATARLAAVGSASKDPTYSNVAALVQDLPVITGDPESIIAQSPDLVVTSPFMSQDTVSALERVGVTVVQTDLRNDPEGRIQDILLLGYMLGEEERAAQFAQEVRARYEELTKVTQAVRAGQRKRVLALTSYSGSIWTAGRGSTEGAVIEAAGGVNPAAEAGIEQNQVTTKEGVISMRPDVIVVTQPPESGGQEFVDDMLSDPALAEVPAIKDKKVFLVDSKLYTTLSFWNLRGAEDLAVILWPDKMSGKQSPVFSTAASTAMSNNEPTY